MSTRNHDYTFAIAEQTLERIKALGLPADPAGFELWYTYVTGSNEDLNRRMNRAIESTDCPSPDEIEEIQEEFLSQSRISSAVDIVSTKISAEIDRIVGMLSELILSTTQDRDDCVETSSRLANSTNRDAVRTISDTLIGSLRAIELRYAALEKQLIASKAEIETAHHALAEVTAQANLDSVTGMANRRAFDSALERATAGANNGRRPLSLLMIDIDHFKVFNDRFGHLMGDTVLRLLSVMIKQSIKDDDLAARYGGEEFAVILTDTDLRGAVELAERIRTRIMSRQLKKRSTGDSLGIITISVGAAMLGRGEPARRLVERADIHLYEAKRSGRNCTRGEDAPPPRITEVI